MRTLFVAFVLSSSLAPLMAVQAESSSVQPIERVYVSPGASGSIESSRSQQRYDVYNGTRVPSDVSETQVYRYSNEQNQTSGGLRQSIEYPDGRVIEQTPGQRTDVQQGYRR